MDGEYVVAWLVLQVGLVVSAVPLLLAWRLLTMPEWERRELAERHERRKITNAMVRLLQGKKP